MQINRRQQLQIHCLAICFVISPCLLQGCTRDSRPQMMPEDELQQGTVTVWVVNYPLKYFAQRIGGEHVRVEFPVPPDEDPAFWRPSADTIAAYQRADLILLNGASYAKWIQTVTLPESKLVDTSAAAADQYIEVADAVTHSHGPGTEHAHTGVAFTTWLDPQLAIAQAEAIRAALAKRRPPLESDFQRGFDQLASDLKDLDDQLGEAVKGKSDRALVFSHPVYQYLQRRYSLDAKSVHWEPDQVASEKQLDELASLLRTHEAKTMVWEGVPMDENSMLLDELGLQSIVFDPCGNVPEEGDFMTVMQQNVKNLKAVLSD